MDKNNENNLNTDDLELLSVDSILADFKAEERIVEASRDGMYARSRPISMEKEDQAIAEAKLSSAEEPNIPEGDTVFAGNRRSEDAVAVDEDTLPPSQIKRARHIPQNPDDTVIFEKRQANEDTPIWSEASDGEQRGARYAPSGDYSQDEESGDGYGRETGFKEKVINPLIGLAASSGAKREERRRAEKARAEKEAKQQLPEMSPEKAARLYMDQALSMRLRCLFASFLSIVLIWLSYGLPAMGLLGNNLLLRTMVCLILELIVILIGLDSFTNGLTSLFKKDSGPESLIAVSCLISTIDAAYILFTKNTDDGLPFCAVSALSLTFALWGSYLECKGFAVSFRTAAIPKTPFVILSEDGSEELGRVLVKVQRPVTGFVRKSEDADIFENGYSLFSPLFIIFAFVLS
ncbi:MAG: hypothetical protein QMB62_11655, partial [Oscillospiraceae bacterium]